MVKRIFNAGLRGLRKCFSATHGGKKSKSFTLLLRLENLLPLSNRLNQPEMAQLFVQLAMRISAAHRLSNSVQMVSQGVYAAILQAQSEAEAMAIAGRLQERGAQNFSVADQVINPVLTGIVMPIPQSSRRNRTATIEQARRRLGQLPDNCLGRITLVNQAALSNSKSETVAAGQDPLSACFQPQMCCSSGNVTGFTVTTPLTRGSNDALPSCIPVQELLAQALDALTAWDVNGWRVPMVFLQISNDDATAPDFSEMVLDSLQCRGLYADRLGLTLTGSAAANDRFSGLHENLGKLLAAGCMLELADFGNGQGDLRMIHDLGIHRVRISSRFTIGCDIDPNQQRMLLAVLAMAEILDITTVADRIATQNEYGYLAQLGCDEVQGPAIAEPMPLSKTFDFLFRHHESVKALPTIPIRKSQ